MRTTPTTALIAVIATAGGLLAGWYAPAPVLPAALFAVLAYAGIVVGLAALFHLDLAVTLLAATLLIVRSTVITLQTLAAAGLHLLATLETALEQWLAHRQIKTALQYTHAA